MLFIFFTIMSGMYSLSTNLKLFRKLKGLSQQKLADALSLKRNNIASYEAGIAEPNASTFLRITNFFEVRPEDFLQKDFSRQPLGGKNGMPGLEIAPPNDEAIVDAMRDLIEQTSEVQKILDGFRAFYSWRSKEAPDETEVRKLAAEIQNLLDVLERLLSINWDFLNETIE